MAIPALVALSLRNGLTLMGTKVFPIRPVDQNIFCDQYANCLQACLATIFRLDLDSVPNFMRAGDNWRKALEDFLASFDLQALYVDAEQMRNIWHPIGFHLIWGTTQRNTFHSVVGLGGKMVHDPHPDRSGLVSEELWTLFVAKLSYGNPVKTIARE